MKLKHYMAARPAYWDREDFASFIWACKFLLRRSRPNGPKCGAKTRRGTPCQMRPLLPWSLRCRLHGGLSTGPKTAEGRQRIAETQRRRWAEWRAERSKRETLECAPATYP
jgi:hypothetical protein